MSRVEVAIMEPAAGPASPGGLALRRIVSRAVTRAEVFDTRDSSGKKPSDHNPLIVTLQVN